MVLLSNAVPYFTDPLIWIGVILLTVLLMARYSVTKGLITQLPDALDNEIGKNALKHGYTLGLLVMLLAIFLKHSELSGAEQSNAIDLVSTEFNNNLSTTDQLSQNIQTLLESHQVVADAMRSGDSVIMNKLFPTQEPANDEVNHLTKTVESSFADLKASNLLKSKTAMQVFNTNKDRIRSLIEPHHKNLISMQDPDNNKYLINTQMWLNHKDVLTRNSDFDQQMFEKNLITLNAVKAQYKRALQDTDAYFTEVLNFMERNTFIGNRAVYEILTKEQQALLSLSSTHTDVTEKIKSIKLQKPF